MQKLNKINQKVDKYWKWFEKGKTKIEVIKYLLGDYNFSGIKAKSDKDKYIIEQISYLISQRRLLQCKKH